MSVTNQLVVWLAMCFWSSKKKKKIVTFFPRRIFKRSDIINPGEPADSAGARGMDEVILIQCPPQRGKLGFLIKLRDPIQCVIYLQDIHR
jgi:hypothetical protein